jgi:hypothetical protein
MRGLLEPADVRGYLTTTSLGRSSMRMPDNAESCAGTVTATSASPTNSTERSRGRKNYLTDPMSPPRPGRRLASSMFS